MRALHLLFLLFISLSFAGQLWVFGADGAVTTRPALFGNTIVVGTEKGAVYGIEAGVQKWTQKFNGSIVGDPAVFGDKIVFATGTTVYALNSAGGIAWTYTTRDVRGITAATDKVYVATSKGVAALDDMGRLAWNYNTTDANEPSAELAGYVVFGSGRKLVALRSTGEKFLEIETGPFWNTRPMVWSGIAYAGTSEGMLYAVDVAQNRVLWGYNAGEIITTTPAHAGAYIIFGTANGWVYAMNNGELAWKARVDSMPEGEVAVDGNVVYFSTRKSLYGISGSDGTVVMKRQFSDWPHPPSVIRSQIILGTQEGKLYAIDSSRACSFLYPEPDALVGDADVAIQGKSYTKYGGLKTYVRVEGGQWSEVGAESWNYTLDPSTFPFGVIGIECYVSDSAGMETSPFSMIQLIKGDAPKPKMKVLYVTDVKDGEPFEIRVLGYDNAPLSSLTAAIGGETFTGDGTITITPKGSGTQTLTVSKKGYENAEVQINVRPQPTLAYVVLFLFLAAAAAYVYFGYIKK